MTAPAPVMAKPPRNARRTFAWDCTDDRMGCYAFHCIPNFHLFSDCLPRNASFTDIDGTTELNGYYFVVELKLCRSALGTGQKLYLERLPPEFFAIVAVCADCRTMDIREVAVVKNGKLGDFRPFSLDAFRSLVRRWGIWAEEQPPAYRQPRAIT